MGSIQKRPDRPKPWRARYRGPDGRQRSQSFRTKVKAERWLRDQLTRLDRGTWVDPSAGRMQFNEWARSWYDGLTGLKPATMAGYRSLLRSRVVPFFGEYQLARIDSAAVRHWIAAMDAEGLSPSRIRQARQVLNAIMNQAYADGLIGRNPVAGCRAPADRPREPRFLSAAQLGALADACEKRMSGARVLIHVLGYLGLRWGEAVALRPSSIDILHRPLIVRESATEVGGSLVFGTPKSHRARSVVIPAFLAEMLSEQLEDCTPEGFVFSPDGASPLRSSNFRIRVWLPSLSDSRLDGLRIHDLRHTAASLAVSAGASIKAVQRMLGHASAQITLDRYAGLYEEDLEMLAERIDAHFRVAAVAQAWPKGAGDIINLRQVTPGRQAPQHLPLWARQDSNLRPRDYESPALTN